MKYIDADKLIAEIDNNIAYCQINYSDDYALGFEQSLRGVKNFIDFLQQEHPEVDLEKEIEEYCGDRNVRPVPDLMEQVARHFYELGLNAKKGD